MVYVHADALVSINILCVLVFQTVRLQDFRNNCKNTNFIPVSCYVGSVLHNPFIINFCLSL